MKFNIKNVYNIQNEEFGQVVAHYISQSFDQNQRFHAPGGTSVYASERLDSTVPTGVESD